MLKVILILLTGISAGIIGGMGMGGGTILIPMLTIFFGISQHTAQAVNLVSFIPMSIAALIVHFKNKLVDFKKVIIIIIPSLFAAGIGSFLAEKTQGHLLQKFFGGFLILLAVLQIVLTCIANGKKADTKSKQI